MDLRWVGLAARLRDAGMWRELDEQDAAAAHDAVAQGRSPYSWFLEEDPGVHWFHVDGEEMAEGQVKYMLGPMAPALRRLGVELRIERVRHDDDQYVISVNGRDCLMWIGSDWDGGNPWVTATVRPLTIVNDLLAEAGATPRVYTLITGSNQCEAQLLDPYVVELIKQSGLVDPDCDAYLACAPADEVKPPPGG